MEKSKEFCILYAEASVKVIWHYSDDLILEMMDYSGVARPQILLEVDFFIDEGQWADIYIYIYWKALTMDKLARSSFQLVDVHLTYSEPFNYIPCSWFTVRTTLLEWTTRHFGRQQRLTDVTRRRYLVENFANRLVNALQAFRLAVYAPLALIEVHFILAGPCTAGE